MKNTVFDNSINELRLRILQSGYTHCSTDWQSRNLSTPFCRLYIPESGMGILECREESIEMIPGSAYLLPPETPVSYCCPDHLVKLFFHLELLSPDHYDLFYGHGHILSIPVPQSALTQYITLYHDQSYHSCLKLKLLLYELLLSFYGLLPLSREQLPSYHPCVRDTMDYIHRNLSAQLSVKELAQRQYISHTTLNKHFHADLGITAGRYIDDLLLMRAKSMLCHTTLSIAEISSRLGFSDQFYFCNKFKSMCGYTPMQYRKTHTDLYTAHRA